MNMKRIQYLASAVAFAAVIGVVPLDVWAQGSDSGKGQSPFMQRFDQDGDGLVSAGEFPGTDDQFDRQDINGDGYIDASEVPEPPPQGPPDPEKIVAEFDTDGDGQLSSAEFPGPADQFNNLDTDGDGFLSARELLAGRPGQGQGDGFDTDDTNQDGRVSEAEFSGPADLFSHLDANGDGYITWDEIPPGPPRGGSTKATEPENEQQ
jgi:EF hand